VKYPGLPPAMRPGSQNEELPVQKTPKNLIFSDKNSDSDEDHGQQEGENFDCDPTFEASSS
jgi:hypothetical protein